MFFKLFSVRFTSSRATNSLAQSSPPEFPPPPHQIGASEPSATMRRLCSSCERASVSESRWICKLRSAKTQIPVAALHVCDHFDRALAELRIAQRKIFPGDLDLPVAANQI